MTGPVPKARTLVTDDGVPIDAVHLPGDRELAIIMAHGFTLSWSRHYVWRVATWLNRSAGVVTFDFRGHGRSGGLSTLGDRAVVLPRHPAHAPGALGGGAAGGPADHPDLAEDPGQSPRLEPGAGLADGGGGQGGADTPPGRPRRSGRVLPGGTRPPALRGRPRPEGTVGRPRVRPRRKRPGHGPDRPDRPLGPAGGEVPGRPGGRAGGRRSAVLRAGRLRR